VLEVAPICLACASRAARPHASTSQPMPYAAPKVRKIQLQVVDFTAAFALNILSYLVYGPASMTLHVIDSNAIFHRSQGSWRVSWAACGNGALPSS